MTDPNISVSVAGGQKLLVVDLSQATLETQHSFVPVRTSLEIAPTAPELTSDYQNPGSSNPNWTEKPPQYSRY